MKISEERLRDILEYNSETGIFRWRVKLNRRISVGSIAGTMCRGYMQIKADGKTYRSHRLAWLYAYGKWPIQQIDHINGNRSDNRIVNLRDISSKANHQNQRKAHRRNKIGLLGVSRSPMRKGYRARIDHVHIGTFATPELAYQAYLQVKRIVHNWGTL